MDLNERPDTFRPIFNVLADWWHEATDSSSSPSRKVNHAAYRRIIELGRPILPYVLRDLETRGGDWFDALAAIQGDIPFSIDAIDTYDGARDAWVRWGRQQGLI